MNSIHVEDKEVSGILRDVMEEYEGRPLTAGQLASLVLNRAAERRVYIEILPAKGGILLERVSLH